MNVRADILDLVRAHDIAPTRAMRAALDDLLTVLADENPDLAAADADRQRDDDDGVPDDDAGIAVRTVDCPHCAEPVVIELELDGGEQEAIHDCSVCCRPIRFAWSARDGALVDFTSGPG
jgi:hypothetical protein